MANDFYVPVYVFSKESKIIHQGRALASTSNKSLTRFDQIIIEKYGTYFLYAITNGDNVLYGYTLWEDPSHKKDEDETLNDFLGDA